MFFFISLYSLSSPVAGASSSRIQRPPFLLPLRLDLSSNYSCLLHLLTRATSFLCVLTLRSGLMICLIDNIFFRVLGLGPRALCTSGMCSELRSRHGPGEWSSGTGVTWLPLRFAGRAEAPGLCTLPASGISAAPTVRIPSTCSGLPRPRAGLQETESTASVGGSVAMGVFMFQLFQR